MSSHESSFNKMITNWGDSKNNRILIKNTYLVTKDLMIHVEDESSAIVDKIVTTTVSLNNKKSLELIWNDRSFLSIMRK